jgi:hypothetical protein
MKRILLAVTMLVLVLPALRQVEARTDVSIDFFYDNLGSDGSWVEVADYGYCWQPSAAGSNSKWRPYSDGYWAYTDVGWTWISYEDFGWATYHYGRWTRLRDRGWFWVPGREWGPAWVSWRTGGDYIGWAPLPPRGGGEVEYDNRPISAQVDVELDIGPSYYNFVDVRYIGEPLLRERIFAPEQNVTYISTTVNVTNITYSNSMVYNYGPDYNTVNRYSTRPIQRLTLQRDANVDLSVAAKSHALTKVQGDKLVVAAPLTLQKQPTPVAPKLVKEKIAKPNFEHGWTGDPKAQAELKQKMKSENPKNVAPPTVKPRENAETVPSPNAAPATSVTATPTTAASPAVSASPQTTTAPAASTSPALRPVSSPPGNRKDARGEKPVSSVAPSSSTAPGTSPVSTPAKAKDKRRENVPSTVPASPGPSGNEHVAPSAPPHDNGTKKINPTEKAPDTAPTVPNQQNDALTNKAPRKPKDEHHEVNPTAPPISSVPSAPPKQEAPLEAPHKQPPADDVLPRERTAPPPGPGPNGPVKTEGPRNKPGPDHKKAEPSPSPTP